MEKVIGTEADFKALAEQFGIIKESADVWPEQVQTLFTGLRQVVNALGRRNWRETKTALQQLLGQANKWQDTGFNPGMKHLAGAMESLIDFATDEARERSLSANSKGETQNG